jgi:hypothetical protein
MHETEPIPDTEQIPDTLRMASTTTTARAALDGVLDALGCDEVLVLVRIAERLKLGRRSYGPLHFGCDTRAFRSKEAREELEDCLVYLACAWLKSETQEVNP